MLNDDQKLQALLILHDMVWTNKKRPGVLPCFHPKRFLNSSPHTQLKDITSPIK